ncbi:arylesterase [Croceicoccus marinus]|jgi:acyl-CoA thioesterase-1|uniref:Arylesterase n=1 Tax=Croceicoccus marinus TaxID=450378 RepID=A0A7G6VSI3_9SPHN|nr:arylesterase [Croceicoccus marinus]QNE04698.1 arylesterase [Croceicoccus marinus]
MPCVALLLAACGTDADVADSESADGEAAGQQADAVMPAGPAIDVLAFGDSLFAGYRLDRGDSYPARLQAALRERGLNVNVTNAGVSGDTTAAGLQRIDFVLDSMAGKPDLVLLELGANDMLRGLPAEEARRNLDTILQRLDQRDIPVMVYGMRAAPNLGGDYGRSFDSIFPDLADKYDAELVPFFIEPLIFDRSLVQQDQLHPTAEGVDAMVEQTVEQVEDRIDDL